MTSTAAPFGIAPTRHAGGGTIRPEQHNDLLASGYASAIGLHSPVTIDSSTSKLRIATTAEAIFGVFAGVIYKPTGATLVDERKNWPAAASAATGQGPYGTTTSVLIWRDPEIIYRIQSSGSIAATAIYDEADFVNPGAVNSNGESTAAINSTLGGNGVQKQLRITGLWSGDPSNAWGDAFTIVEVQIAQLQNIAPQTGV